MAKLAKVTVTLLDDFQRTTKRSYTHRTSDNPPEADVTGLLTDLQALTALSVIDAQVTYPVDVSAIQDAVESDASRQNDWSMEVRKSLLRNSRGGSYTFNLPQPKAALTGPTKQIDTTQTELNDWIENFDDGAGIAAIAGNWYVSDGEELVEATGGDQIIDAYLNKD